jgi:hypothetical protein
MFQPAVPLGGYAGWKAFERTIDRQVEAYSSQSSVQRDLEYFHKHIGAVATVDDLIRDRRMLTIALGAFGLEDEIAKKAIIRRVLSDAPEERSALVNKMNDPRWRQFAKSFGIVDGSRAPAWPRSARDAIVSMYLERSFERAVGDQEASFRLAMNFRREIREIAGGANVERVGWVQILGRRPLRTVLEAALILPQEIAQLDVDKQRAMFERKAMQTFGESSPRAFLDDANVELAIQRYFAVDSAASPQGGYLPGASALTLLRGTALSAGASINLIMSNRVGN